MYGFDKKIGTADDLAKDKYGIYATRNTQIEMHLNRAAKQKLIPIENLPEMLEKALSKPKGEPVKAIINQNRLIAYCDMCGGAEAINPGGSFYCLTCYNIGNDGVSRPITFPRQLQNII